MRQVKQSPDDDSDEEEDLDLMEDDYLELLCTPPGNRKPKEVDGIMEVLRRYATDLTESISEENLGLVASTCLYHFFAPGEVVCEPNEHADFYFVILRGTVDVEEPTLHHQEHLRGLNDADPSWAHRRKRTTEHREGSGFHHLPLATGTVQYGYKAFVGDPYEGASIVLLPHDTYCQVLQRTIERTMSRAVATLRSTPFFSSWSERSVERLYFWLSKQEFAPEEDIVEAGEIADTCFVLLSGRANVLVPLTQEELSEQREQEEASQPKKEKRSSRHGGPSPNGSHRQRRMSSHGEEEEGSTGRRGSVTGVALDPPGSNSSSMGRRGSVGDLDAAGASAEGSMVAGRPGSVTDVDVLANAQSAFGGLPTVEDNSPVRRKSLSGEERQKVAESALSALVAVGQERRKSVTSVLEAPPKDGRKSDYAQYVMDRYERVATRTTAKDLQEDHDSNSSADPSLISTPEPSFKQQRRNSLVDATDKLVLRKSSIRGDGSGGIAAVAGALSANLPRRGSVGEFPQVRKSATSMLSLALEAGKPLATDPLPRRSSVGSGDVASVLAAAANASEAPALTRAPPRTSFADVVVAASSKVGKASRMLETLEQTADSLDNLLVADEDDSVEGGAPAPAAAAGPKPKRRSNSVAATGTADKFMNALSGLSSELKQRRRDSVTGVDDWTGASFRRGSVLGALPSKADLARRAHGGPNSQQAGAFGQQMGSGGTHTLIAGVLVPNEPPPNYEDSSSSSSTDEDEEVSDEEKEDYDRKKVADKEARKAEKVADKVRRAAQVAAQHVEEAEKSDEEDEDQHSTFKRWQRAQAKAKVIAAKKKKADAILEKAVQLEKRASRAAEKARKIHMEVELTSFRRRQSQIEEMMAEEGMHDASTAAELAEALKADITQGVPMQPAIGRRGSVGAPAPRDGPAAGGSFRERQDSMRNERREMRGASQRGMSVLMQGADAFRTAIGSASTPLYANHRHVVTLHAGSLVGEIALLNNERRMATVKAAEPVEVLSLSKDDFFLFEPSTLHLIRDNARYNAAVSKAPEDRSEEDLRLLQQRTAMLMHFAGIELSLHLQLCQAMKYRKVTDGVVLVRKGQVASVYYIVISGAVAVYRHDPKEARRSVAQARRSTLRGIEKFIRMSRQRESNVNHFRGLPPDMTLREGEAYGDEDLAREEGLSSVTLVVLEAAEFMEVPKKDYDRIMKEPRRKQHEELVNFFSECSVTRGVSPSGIEALAKAAVKRTHTRDQICLAHPPHAATLGSASFSPDHVYMIASGEGQLYCSAPSNGNAAATSPLPPIADKPAAESTRSVGLFANSNEFSRRGPPGPRGGDASEKKDGDDGASHVLKIVEKPLPAATNVQKHMGGPPILVATLGRGECLFDEMLKEHSKWCLRSASQLVMLVIPRKEWAEVLRPSGMMEMRALAAAKASFYDGQLKRTLGPHPQVAPTFSLRRPLARPSSMATLPSGPRGAALLSQLERLRHPKHLNMPPGAFIPGGHGHGVVVPPPKLASSMSLGELVPRTQQEKPEEPSVSEYIAIHHSTSPRVQYRHWYDELDLNPAFLQKHAEGKKGRRPKRVTT